ncbi:uncharacterized protein LOC135212068 [Macrobrachium nipponense]|uniref:uncharacterized protein LOC135212068 n=1 Tax=Macrobrachium nipponense TaxID=159736 RepID=UPI0030C8B899
MVFLRAAALAWLGVLPVVWCLPLEGVRSAPHQQQPTLLEDLSLNNLPSQGFTQDDYQQLLTRQPDSAAAALNSYDASETLPYMYRLQEGIAGAGLPATGLDGDVTRLENPDWMAVDPRSYLLAQFLEHPAEEATGSESNSMIPIRKIRNSSNTSSITNSNFENANSQAKRAWPHGFSRRRSSGLSLSIDASMKVLREALYLEMARKKQRQQMQRARHNQELLTSIGKRDVQQQLRGDGPGQDHLPGDRI